MGFTQEKRSCTQAITEKPMFDHSTKGQQTHGGHGLRRRLNAAHFLLGVQGAVGRAGLDAAAGVRLDDVGLHLWVRRDNLLDDDLHAGCQR